MLSTITSAEPSEEYDNDFLATSSIINSKIDKNKKKDVFDRLFINNSNVNNYSNETFKFLHDKN